jgi:hypothetical protein
MTIQFNAISTALAEFTVETDKPGFTLTEVRFLLHHVGFAGAPLFEIERQRSPDDPWDIRPLDGQRIISTTECRAPAGSLDWIPPRFADRFASLAHHLPAGKYYVVRHLNRPPSHGRVLLGNEWVSNPGAHLQALFNLDRNYAGVIGSIVDRSPDVSQPLLGVSVLNFTGDPIPYSALFFSCLEPSSPDDTETTTDELLLIVPSAGPLVFDNMSHYSAEQSAREKSSWAETYAKRYAKKLAGKG